MDAAEENAPEPEIRFETAVHHEFSEKQKQADSCNEGNAYSNEQMVFAIYLLAEAER